MCQKVSGGLLTDEDCKQIEENFDKGFEYVPQEFFTKRGVS